MNEGCILASAAGTDARRRDAGDTGISSRSANAADAPAPPEPFGRIGIAGNLCVARRQRCPRIASSSRLELARNTYARDPLYFHHGLLSFINPKIDPAQGDSEFFSILYVSSTSGKDIIEVLAYLCVIGLEL
jgi:hypothetical protein